MLGVPWSVLALCLVWGWPESLGASGYHVKTLAGGREDRVLHQGAAVAGKSSTLGPSVAGCLVVLFEVSVSMFR